MSTKEYFNRPNQMTYHDLRSPTEFAENPLELGCLLGLGNKFCIQEERPKRRVLDDTFMRFRRDVRLKYTFAGVESNDEYEKKIYVKSDWDPGAANVEREEILSTFEYRLRTEREFSLARPRATNLSKHQYNILNHLRSNKDIIVLICDKNLGPSVMQRETYIKEVLRQHLQDKDSTYKQISESTARSLFSRVESEIATITSGTLPPIEAKYFANSLLKPDDSFRDSVFYGMPKVHKKKVPTPLRPVVSQCGSLLAVPSTYLDFKLQPLRTNVQSYIKDSYALILKLLKLRQVPRGARVFTSDAVSMYSNIDPVEGINTIEKYLTEFAPHILPDEREIILDLLRLVMNNCFFKFGNTYWLQLIGTAMGTPVACIYAILFFAYFERTILLPKYKKNLLMYVWQIDDIFGIWIDDPDNPNAWEDFQLDLNGACKLEWDTIPLSTSVDFLDITISLNPDGEISTRTYQKPENLFLYIPPHSSHPPGLMKSLVFGLLLTYYLQNTLVSDFYKMTQLLFTRLIARGHQSTDLKQLFLDATAWLEERYNPMVDKKDTTNLDKTSENVIFFHIPFHSRDISRQKIRDIYEKTCEADPQGLNFKSMPNDFTGTNMRIDRVTVAYSRPKKLRDYLCPSTLSESSNVYVSKYVTS